MFHRLLTIFFPSPCLVCGYLEELLCSHCHDSLKFIPHIRKIKNLKICSPLLYKKGQVIEQLIESFKYKHQAKVFRYFVPKMAEALRLLHFNSNAILVPVPLHPLRKRERGYNQAELLAKALSKKLGLDVKHYLRRVKHTTKQAHLKSRSERQGNLEDAFEIIERPPQDRQLILVDDIVTTGSTLLACFEKLSQAGSKSIIALTLANREKETPHPWNRCLKKHTKPTDRC